MKFELNWRPDLPDPRDLIYQVTAPVEVPQRVDLRADMPPIVNQGSIGSCTANALAGNLGFLQQLELKKKGKQVHEYNSKRFVPASRLFMYYNARALIGMQNQDSGAYLRDGIKALNQVGVCREDLWKYTQRNLYKKPTKGPLTEAAKYKISQYMRLSVLFQMEQCLAEGFPFVFGFSVMESFYNVGANGLVPLPKKGERVLGGHAVLCVGYDSVVNLFTIRNSWGSSWGDKGHCYMPFEYLNNSQLASDFWTIRV